MTTLSDTQKAILLNAHKREDGKILPFPKHVKAKGGAITKVLHSLQSKGFIEEDAGGSFIITTEGQRAAGVKIADEELHDDESAAQEPEEPTVKEKPAPTAKASGTPKGKLGEMLTLLKREEGATITDLMEAAGWQKHSVRGAISGQLKKKYGFQVKQVATKGEEIIYQIV